MSTGTVPDRLKIAKIVPIYKKGSITEISNYRPISLLSIFDKILEKIVNKRLLGFLNKHDILYTHQYGFRSNHSTTFAVIDAIDAIYGYLDRNEYVIGTFFDLSKAFDTVNHDILLHKLQLYGIRGIANQWFASYLSNREQYVSIDKTNSQRIKVKHGVPQGSVLGPLLFILYINDISKCIPNHEIKLFADDTNLFTHGKDIKLLVSQTNTLLSELNIWFITNKLSLNADKTYYSVYSPTKPVCLSVYSPTKPVCLKQENLELSINRLTLEQVKICKYLGVIIDEELSWKDHIKYVIKKIVKFASIFYKLRSLIPSYCLKQIYYALVHSHILYAVEIYANTFITYIDPLIKVNNKLLRILQNKPWRTPVKSLYHTYSTLPVPDLHKLQLLCLVHRFLYNNAELPVMFQNYFILNCDVHTYGTRSCDKLHVSGVNKQFGLKSVKVKSCRLWNSLPKYVTQIVCLRKFKNAVKLCLGDQGL